MTEYIKKQRTSLDLVWTNEICVLNAGLFWVFARRPNWDFAVTIAIPSILAVCWHKIFRKLAFRQKISMDDFLTVQNTQWARMESFFQTLHSCQNCNVHPYYIKAFNWKNWKYSKCNLVPCLSFLSTLLLFPTYRVELDFTVFAADQSYMPLVVCW